ncbi:amidohydrolase family protein [Paenibacillus sp. 481]|uniref:amidohydrolase family protein n=1 Tax=Paenibacillus sp. 481 TaxID=2835869 RepID=UPI001E4434CF|nr:amidohydrolase family protein [Paenibacillus sp. 481]UHA74879.1 amidohydrolase family protein [Paenibacillus sp. 481]
MTANKACWIKNVRLEQGFATEDGVVVGTETTLNNVYMEAGKITRVEAVGGSSRLAGDVPVPVQYEESTQQEGVPHFDAQGLLMLPAFKEMHIHIDKTYYGGPWKAVRPAASIFDRFAEERELLPKQVPTARHRAEKMLELMLGYGATHIRTHCNVDPIIGLQNMEATLQALDTYAGKLSAEIVAFPQHGLLLSDSVQRVREAMRMGATHVGGVDPATVDGNIDKSLHTIMEIAVEANAGVDIHIHERDHLGIYSMRKLAELTEQAGWQGRVTVSHAFGFAGVAAGVAGELAARFAELDINVTSTIPIGAIQMPIPLLREKGVRVELGNDSITDHWSPFGTGDMLEKANRMAELYRYADELSLARALECITGGITPLNESGQQVWPAVGAEANAVFVEASCSAEAVARRSPRRAVMYQGKVVAGSL